MKISLKSFLLAGALLSGQALAADSLLDKINQHKVVSVGTEGTYPPFSYHDQSGRLTGYDVEVAREVGKKLGFTVRFEETPWDAMLAGLKGGRFDLVANQVSLTSEARRATFDRTVAYSYSGAVGVAKKDNDKIKSIDDIKGLKAAQTLSSNYGEKAVQAGAKIVPVDGLAQALLLIEQGRADVTLNSSLAILDYFKKNPNSKLEIKWYAPKNEWLGAGLTANKGNKEALDKLNAAIDQLREDGTLKRLGEQFFGQDISKNE